MRHRFCIEALLRVNLRYRVYYYIFNCKMRLREKSSNDAALHCRNICPNFVSINMVSNTVNVCVYGGMSFGL